MRRKHGITRGMHLGILHNADAGFVQCWERTAVKAGVHEMGMRLVIAAEPFRKKNLLQALGRRHDTLVRLEWSSFNSSLDMYRESPSTTSVPERTFTGVTSPKSPSLYCPFLTKIFPGCEV